MSELPYKVKDLQDYTGILTQHVDSENFKMELKVEDNPVLRRSVEEIDRSIELVFHHNLGTSTLFFHNIFRCPCTRQSERRNESGRCDECDKVMGTFKIFKENLKNLQVGDTFSIKAALINNKQSELPVKIHFKDYERIEVACVDYYLRLPDTPEGIKKKLEREEQRLQQEREDEDNRKKAEDDAKRRKRNESIKQFFGERPYIPQIIVSAIGGVIAGIILAITVEPIQRLFRWIISFF